jgi:hypothetical protein
MADEHDNGEQGDAAEPETLEEAREQLRVLRKELTSVRKESARRRQALKERDGQEADAGIWRTVALEAVVQAEAAAAGAHRPEMLGRLVDVSGIEGDTLEEIRSSVREQVEEAQTEAPELFREPTGVGVRSPGVQNRQRRERPADPDAWLRRAARSGR